MLELRGRRCLRRGNQDRSASHPDCRAIDDPDPERRQGLDRHRPHRRARQHPRSVPDGSEELEARFSCRRFLFRSRRGDLFKTLWHYALGMSRYAKRLDRGKFIWPSASVGAVSIWSAQRTYMLEGIDWRNPQLSWTPQSAP
ncbi:transposase [Bradyrhizobium rifense]|uniref:Transposase n=1 Tax=Bradyrhizobium rifense TaxID=515499 RepID=A0A5D3K9S8_9BRAD|nr:transposase [Bradyrhizobium rifense]